MSDFSCYVSVLNRSSLTIQVYAPPPQSGWWDGLPETIAPATRASFRLHDPSGPIGSEGSLQFMVQGAPVPPYLASFQDGYVQDNYCNIEYEGAAAPYQWSFQGASGDAPPDNWEQNGVPGGGHPVYLRFIFSDGTITGDQELGG